MIRAALVLSVGLATQASAAGDPAASARDAADRLDRAAELLSVPAQGYGRVTRLTRVIRAYEDGLSALRTSRREAAEAERALVARFDANAGRVGAVLGALASIGEAPEAALLLHPDGPVQTARAGMLMQAVTPAMMSGVATIRADLERLRDLRALQETVGEELSDGLDELQAARAALTAEIEKRGTPPAALGDDPVLLARIAEGARTLSDFAASLPDGTGAAAPDFAQADGLDLPVLGHVTRRFAAADQPGWSIAAEPGALVTSPVPATIRYGGPLLDYKNVMVLEPTEGYLLVFAGLGEVYGAAGDVLPAGGPVGLIGGSDRPGEAAELYLEVRRDGRPEDPAGWFVSGNG